MTIQVIVSGKHLDIGDALRNKIENDIMTAANKYFSHAVKGHAVVEQRGRFFHTEIIIHDGTGNHTLVRGDGEDADAHKSSDIAIERVIKQLQRYKEKMHDLHKRGKEFASGTKRLFNVEEDEDPFEEYDDSEDFIELTRVISEQSIKIEQLSVRDAIMKMNLLNLKAMLFISINTGALNMVYYKTPSTIAWVETELCPQQP